MDLYAVGSMAIFPLEKSSGMTAFLETLFGVAAMAVREAWRTTRAIYRICVQLGKPGITAMERMQKAESGRQTTESARKYCTY